MCILRFLVKFIYFIHYFICKFLKLLFNVAAVVFLHHKRFAESNPDRPCKRQVKSIFNLNGQDWHAAVVHHKTYPRFSSARQTSFRAGPFGKDKQASAAFHHF